MRKQLKMAVVALGLLAAGVANAQKTSGNFQTQGEAKPGSGTTGSVRLIDNKGTIKYLQANNGITALTNDANGVTTTTWQLGGTLTDNTYIDASGVEFGITGLKAITSSDNAASAYDSAGYTIVVRDETSGEMKKILASELLQVQSGHIVLNSSSTPVLAAAGTAMAIGDLSENFKNVSVYRNGAKLTSGVDYTVTAGNLTLNDKSAAPAPLDWTLYPSVDTIEVHWVK